MGLNIDASGRRNSTNSKEEVRFYEPNYRLSHRIWLIDYDLAKASQGQEGQNNAVGGGDWKKWFSRIRHSFISAFTNNFSNIQ